VSASATDLARRLVAALAASGLRHVVLCPGSRSAPLAYAVHDLAATGALDLHVRHDERVAAFTALGMGRATGVPAAVVTTSGTAVANLLPAILEAHHAGVPLLVLAADRPARLRGTWANQTSDLQAGLFGAATRLTADLATQDSAAAWAAAARAAVEAAMGGGGRPGPVHLNLGFDDPLVPSDGDEVWPAAAHADAQADAERPGATSGARRPAEPAQLPLTPGTVVVAGDRAGPAARQVAEALGLPLLAEPTSGARSGANAVGPYRLLLDHPDLGGRVDRALVFGRPTLSRPVTRLLGRPEVVVVRATQEEDEPGPERTDVQEVRADELLAWADGARSGRSTGGEEWCRRWTEAGRRAADALDRVLDGWPVLTGPLVAREVAASTGATTPLVLAASNAVRDADLAGRPWAWPPGHGLVHANRGLSGIDGTVSTASGVALATQASTRVLVGDVAFLHDLGALVLGPAERRPDLTVVVLNDGGGGIFSLLEPGADGERDHAAYQRFERLFGTPQQVALATVCQGLGVPHVTVASAAGLRERLGELPVGLRVVEVRVDREDLRPLHDALRRAVTSALAP
jgi:2-succinyl-5-enolpyruvyl-6-hydroxy-3-cyclohexene-1-carboxylate synthase